MSAGAAINETKITGFIQDEMGDWIAELACGHTQHVRHKPPWQDRPWTLTAESRASMIGEAIECGQCARAGKNKKQDD